MRHVVEPHMSIQEPLPSKQVIIGKVDGQANPAGNIKCNVFLHGIGLIDLTQKRFDENARRTKVRVVAIGAGFQKWKPPMALTNLRKHNGTTLPRRRVIPGHWRETLH